MDNTAELTGKGGCRHGGSGVRGQEAATVGDESSSALVSSDPGVGKLPLELSAREQCHWDLC